MATPSILQGDYIIQGALAVGTELIVPAGTIGNDQLGISDPVNTSKLDHRFIVTADQDIGSDVVADTHANLYLARNAGTIVGVKAKVHTAPTGGDKAFQLDIEKAAAGSITYATILTATIDFDSGDANGDVLDGTLTVTTFAAEDNFRLVVTVSGTTGSQGQGFSVALTLDEET